jgi:hypothetical protein
MAGLATLESRVITRHFASALAANGLWLDETPIEPPAPGRDRRDGGRWHGCLERVSMRRCR